MFYQSLIVLAKQLDLMANTPRCAELNDRDTEAKESVSVLYCQSTSEQLFRKKAWLDKMEKDLPHYTTTHRLKCHVLQESGN